MQWGNDGIHVSDDGLDWRKVSETGAVSIAYGDGRYVAHSGGGTLTSTNGIDWKEELLVASTASVTYGNGLFAAATGNNDDPSVILISTNGSDWLLADSRRHDSITKLAFLNNRFVALQRNGKGLVSADLEVWTPFETKLPNAPLAVTEFKGGYIAISRALHSSGHLSHSLDGLDWQLRVALAGKTLTGVAASSQRALAVGDAWANGMLQPEGVLLSSEDGVSWSEQSFPFPASGVAYGAGKFVVTGVSNSLATSPDGSHWTIHPDLPGRIDHLNYIGGHFVATGRTTPAPGDMLLVSDDGLAWSQHRLAYPVSVRSSAFGADSLLIGAHGPGTIQQSARFTSVPKIHLVPLPDGRMRIAAWNPSQVETQIDSSTDLTGWEPKVTSSDMEIEFEEGAGLRQQFYRVRMP